MYCQLLENAVRELKNLPPQESVEAHIDLPWPAYLPRDYVPGQKLRIEVYRRLARLRERAQLQEFRQELIDRYGPLPLSAEWLLRTTEVRLLCGYWKISTIHRNGPDVVLSYRDRRRAEELVRQGRGRLKIVDDSAIYLRLRAGEEEPERLYRLLCRLLQSPAPAETPLSDSSPATPSPHR